MQETVSTKTLVKASGAALGIATLALVSFILPAEYNIDPTGIGGALGLTALSKPASEGSVSSNDSDESEREIIEVTVPAGEGIEYKFQMSQFEKMTYEWMTDGPSVHFDLHGEPQGDTTGYFESYALADLGGMKGSFIAPFTGSHGWYWKNTTNSPIAIQLIVHGQYEVIGLK